MRTLLLFALLVTATPQTVFARFVTLIVSGGAMSNAVTTIKESETARVVSGRDDEYFAFRLEVRYTNALVRFFARDLMGIDPNGTGAPPWNAIVVRGPADLVLLSNHENRTTVKAAYVTLEIIPESFPPDKTIVIPEGGGANIALECSTNLIDWTAASLGVYTNQPTAKFFRLRAERVP